MCTTPLKHLIRAEIPPIGFQSFNSSLIAEGLISISLNAL